MSNVVPPLSFSLQALVAVASFVGYTVYFQGVIDADGRNASTIVWNGTTNESRYVLILSCFTSHTQLLIIPTPTESSASFEHTPNPFRATPEAHTFATAVLWFSAVLYLIAVLLTVVSAYDS